MVVGDNIEREFLLLKVKHAFEVLFLIIAKNFITVYLQFIMANSLPADVLFEELFANADLLDPSDPRFIKIRNEFFKITLEADLSEWQTTIWVRIDMGFLCINTSSRFIIA
jgi:hypothetical protein